MSDEHRYRWLFRKSPALMHSIDVEGRYVDLSDAWLERLGYEREEVIGRRPQDLNTPTSAQRITEEYFPRFLRTGRVMDVPVQMVAKSGEIVDFLVGIVGWDLLGSGGDAARAIELTGF